MCRVHLTMRTEGITAFSNRYGVVVWTGENDTKTISVDANLFENGAKQLRFRLKTDTLYHLISNARSWSNCQLLKEAEHDMKNYADRGGCS